MIKTVTVNILFYFLILATHSVFPQGKPTIAEKEIKGSPTIDFLNKTIIRANDATKQNDINTGKKLAELIAQIPNKIHSVDKVNLQRISPTKDSFGGDIITIAPEKNFGHINRFHRIITGYIQSAFQYDQKDADLISRYIIYYNGLHRKHLEYFKKKYTSPLAEHLNSKYVGISTNYKEWLGKTQIIIPIEIGATNKKDIQLEELKDEVTKIIENKPDELKLKKKFDDIIETKIKKDKEVIKEEKEEIAKAEDEVTKKAEKIEEKLDELKKNPEENKEEIAKVEKEKQDIEKEKEDIEAKKDEIQEKEEILTQKEKSNQETETKKEDSPKDETTDAVAKLEPEKEDVPPKPETPEEKLDKVEKELEATKQELEEKKEEEKKKSEYSPNVLDNKIVFLKTTKYLDKGHYNNEIHLIDPENDDSILKSEYTNICGKSFQIFNEQVLVLGYNDTHENSHKLALLNKKDLKFQAMSKAFVFWRTPMIIMKSPNSGEEELYAFEEDGEKYFLARFDKDLKRVARSNEEINPNSSVTFFGTKIYITAKEDSANKTGIQVLSRDELKTIKKNCSLNILMITTLCKEGANTCFLFLYLLFQNGCMYTGGGDTISGKEAKQKIEAKVMYMAWSGYTIAESSKNLDNFSCVVSPSANLIIDIENNDYTYKAQTINVPTKEKPSIRIQGKIEDDTDQDYYYMYVPSDTNNVTLYFRETGSPDVGCYLYTDNSSYQYFSNNWSKLPLSRSSYVYIKCYKGSETGFYDMEITINKQDTSNSSDSDTKRSYYLGRLMEPYFFKFTNKIENHKYYTRHSLNRCLSRLNLVILATGFLDTWNYHYSLKCDSTYTPLNPYLSAALSCTLDEADFIQIGK